MGARTSSHPQVFWRVVASAGPRSVMVLSWVVASVGGVESVTGGLSIETDPSRGRSGRGVLHATTARLTAMSVGAGRSLVRVVDWNAAVKNGVGRRNCTCAVSHGEGSRKWVFRRRGGGNGCAVASAAKAYVG